MPLNLTNEKSILLQVMAWHCQAPSHYLSQWWPRYKSSYGGIRPQAIFFIYDMDSLFIVIAWCLNFNEYGYILSEIIRIVLSCSGNLKVCAILCLGDYVTGPACRIWWLVKKSCYEKNMAQWYKGYKKNEYCNNYIYHKGTADLK